MKKKKINAAVAPMTSDIRFRARKKRANFSADRPVHPCAPFHSTRCNLLEPSARFYLSPLALLLLFYFAPLLFLSSFFSFPHFLHVRYVDRLSKTAVQRFITLYFYRGHFRLSLSRLCAEGIGGGGEGK